MIVVIITIASTLSVWMADHRPSRLMSSNWTLLLSPNRASAIIWLTSISNPTRFPLSSLNPNGGFVLDVPIITYPRDRKSVVEGKSVSVRVDLGGRRINNKKTNQNKYKKSYKNRYIQKK